jgi:hypothetical protein
MDWDELEAAVLAAPDCVMGAGLNRAALGAGAGASDHALLLASAALPTLPAAALGLAAFGGGVGAGAQALPPLPMPLLQAGAPLPVLRCLNAAHAPGCMRCVASPGTRVCACLFFGSVSP